MTGVFIKFLYPSIIMFLNPWNSIGFFIEQCIEKIIREMLLIWFSI